MVGHLFSSNSHFRHHDNHFLNGRASFCASPNSFSFLLASSYYQFPLFRGKTFVTIVIMLDRSPFFCLGWCNFAQFVDIGVAAENDKQSTVPYKLRLMSGHCFPIEPRLIPSIDPSIIFTKAVIKIIS